MFDNYTKTFRCLCCSAIFTEDEADVAEVDLEAENGVGGLFPDHHTAQVYVCPDCSSDEIEEYEEEEEEEEDANE